MTPKMDEALKILTANPVYTVLLTLLTLLSFRVVKFLVRTYQVRSMFQTQNLPCPPGHSWLWGHLRIMDEMYNELPMDTHPHMMCLWLQKKYNLPAVFYLDIWPMDAPQVHVTDPDVAQMCTVQQNLDKHPSMSSILNPIIGPHNMVGANGAMWKLWRGIFNPGFASGHIMSMVPEIVKETLIFRNVLRKRADKGDIFRMEEDATRYTVDVIGRVVLDIELKSQSTENELIVAFRDQLSWLPNPQDMNIFRTKLNPLRHIHYYLNSRKMRLYLKDVLDRRFASGSVAPVNNATAAVDTRGAKKKKHIIDIALETSKNSNTSIDFNAGVTDQVLTFIFAGHDTTSSTICYAYHLLSKDPQALRRIREEHAAVFGSDIEAVPDAISSDPYILNRLPYTTAVLKETLRLYPAASSTRLGERGFYITDPATGRRMPTEGCLVWIIHQAMHRRGELFPLPGEFWPERFLSAADQQTYAAGVPQEVLATQPHPAAWRPFEKGPRNCIGQDLAMTEMKIAAALTIREFEFQAVFEEEEGWEKKIAASMTGHDTWGSTGGTSGWSRKGVKQVVEGEKWYQVLIATAKPKEGMPCRVRRVQA